MWIVDLWLFEAGQATHQATSEAEDRESAVDEAQSALALNDALGATVYDQQSGAGFPIPEQGKVVVQAA